MPPIVSEIEPFSVEHARILWLVVCAGLVFVMQAGFLCLESGLTRSKNSINVAIMNVADFGIATILYWMFGFGVMFGVTQSGWFGTDRFLPSMNDGWDTAFFLFQLMFAGAATTIVSGAVAERMKFSGYLLVSGVLSGLVYTVFGHWVWNGIDSDQPGGWLYQLGFRDFAGVTVVHGVGGWVALAAVLVVGPRRGRFTDDGASHEISGHDLPMAMLGAMLLMFGWFGFNGGSLLRRRSELTYPLRLFLCG